MATRMISMNVLQAFREVWVGGATLQEISDLFEAEDFQADVNFHPNTNSQRRTLVEQYYHGIDLTNSQEVRRLLRVFEAQMIRLSGFSEHDWAKKELENLSLLLHRDGYHFENHRLIGGLADTPHVNAVRLAEKLSADEIIQELQRIAFAVDSDPSLAVGTAKELVESCCKTILRERSISPVDSTDMPKLVRQTLGSLSLLPADIPDHAKGAGAYRKLVMNLAVAVDSLAEIRNLYGTGHGKDGSFHGVQPRHARLVVTAAQALTNFLIETHFHRGKAPKQ